MKTIPSNRRDYGIENMTDYSAKGSASITILENSLSQY
jgi:hypothetical protein